MSQPYDAGAGATPGILDTTDVGARTRAFLGLSLAFVGLLGGGVLANALFYLILDASSYGSGGSGWLQALPSLAMGVLGGGLGWSASTSGDALAVPVGRTATAIGLLAVLGGIALALTTQV